MALRNNLGRPKSSLLPSWTVLHLIREYFFYVVWQFLCTFRFSDPCGPCVRFYGDIDRSNCTATVELVGHYGPFYIYSSDRERPNLVLIICLALGRITGGARGVG